MNKFNRKFVVCTHCSLHTLYVLWVYGAVILLLLLFQKLIQRTATIIITSQQK